MKTISRLTAMVGVGILSVSTMAFSDETVFCPQKNGYIRVGMTEAQVLSACGAPLQKQESNKPLSQKVEVTQMTYNNQGTQKGFYGYWKMPVSTNSAGNGGSKLEVSIVDGKVDSVNIDGGSVNAFSICGNNNIQIGDDASAVAGACGTPSIVNKTFIMKPIPSNKAPMVWIYKQADYLPTMTLTFVDGKLQSIQ